MSNKSEALALLALDELTLDQCIRLNYLTAKQAGFHSVAIVMYSVFVSAADNPARSWFVEYVRGMEAVGHCLTLPLPRYYFWRLWGQTSGIDDDSMYAEILYAVSIKEDSSNMSTRSLPIAMLRAWWTIQKDD